MELYEREYFVARILSGYLRYRINKDLVLKIHSPNVDQLYQAQEIFQDARKEARVEGIMTSEELFAFMMERELWTEEDEILLEQLPKDLESFKEQLYNNRYKVSQTEQLRKYIDKARSEYIKILTKRYNYDYCTCEGYGAFCKGHWIIENCTFYESGESYDWSHVDSSALLKFYKSEEIVEKTYREIARSEPFRTKWALGGSAQGVFGVCTKDITSEQQSISMYCRMYDNVRESMEAPEESVIEDDDMLDGWFVVQRKKREADKKRSQAESVGHGNAQDVFIMADGKEDIDRIHSMNDTRAKVVSQQRHKVTEERGRVKHQDLPDVRRDINMQANQMQSSKKG